MALTNAEKQARRNTKLNTVAKGVGFETWRKLETAVINEVDINRLLFDDNYPEYIRELVNSWLEQSRLEMVERLERKLR